MLKKITALVGCQNEYCATETSYPLHMVRIWDGAPICEYCYDELPYTAYQPAIIDEAKGELIGWDKLPPVTLGDLIE